MKENRCDILFRDHPDKDSLTLVTIEYGIRHWEIDMTLFKHDDGYTIELNEKEWPYVNDDFCTMKNDIEIKKQVIAGEEIENIHNLLANALAWVIDVTFKRIKSPDVYDEFQLEVRWSVNLHEFLPEAI